MARQPVTRSTPQNRRGRNRLAFSTQTLLLQLGVVVLVVVGTGGLYSWFTYDQLTAEVEARALSVAQSVAADTDVRALVTHASAADRLPSNEELRKGPLQEIGESVRTRTDALFVVITDDDGIRFSHPTPSLLGKKVSTSPEEALSGKEITAQESGTLGSSVRAKVPIWSSGGHTVVGEVSAGFASTDILTSLGTAVVPIMFVVAGALLLGALASAFLVRRLRKLTMGLEPEEIMTLVQDQEVVLYGVAEGVIGIASDGRVTVCNAKARRLLRLPDVIGRHFRTLSVPAPIIDLLENEAPSTSATVQVVVGPTVLLVSSRKVVRGNSDLGWVVTVLDRTQVEELTRQLDAVGALSAALRVQRHEFANRLHIVLGLLTTGETAEAAHYLQQTLETGPLEYPLEHADRLSDSYLQAFIGAKGFQAAERGILLRIGAETVLRGSVIEPQDVTTVLGNLIDNAIEAAVHGSSDGRWVEVEVLSENDTLHLVVADSGDGVRGDREWPFEEGHSTRSQQGDSAHGQGLGLPLSRRVARNRGGDLWLASAGEFGGPGATFCARLPGVLGRETAGLGASNNPDKLGDSEERMAGG
jgi:two-component system CitB family sensor kinase